MTQTSQYMTVTETAKLIRAALAANFPGTTFSVRSKSYSGGASVRVHWTDGPNTSAVDAIARRYQGASFDPMVDLKSYHSSVLVSEQGPREVHFGADFVSCARTITKELERRAEADQIIRARCGGIKDDKWGDQWVSHLAADMVYALDFTKGETLDTTFRRVVLRREN